MTVVELFSIREEAAVAIAQKHSAHLSWSTPRLISNTMKQNTKQTKTMSLD